ncbi:transposase [Patescibacteria group bacterium]|nr:transposase [Patescibacteria group bacterium]
MSTLRINQETKDLPHFITLTVIEWIDLFTKPNYLQVIQNSLNYCIKNKDLIVYEYVVMPNHLHLIVKAGPGGDLAGIIRDFKRHTTKEIYQLVELDTRRYLKNLFSNSFARKEEADKQIWQRENYPEPIETQHFFETKQQYIYNNPVKKLLVDAPENWLYSSASTRITGKINLINLANLPWE